MIDAIDIKIITILQNNARSTASDIGKEVNLSVPAAAERIKKLSESGLIKNFSAILDNKKVGLDLIAYVFIISEHSDNYEDFIKKVNNCVSVMECHSITGGGSHLLKICVKNSKSLEDLLYEIQNWPGVSHTRTNVVLSTYKQSTNIDLSVLTDQ
tara:strand:- start:245 stop:709 length:465 start_codon:yes stop_codon:yes gene_type:complete